MTLRGRFEWDDDKDTDNQLKHGVSFDAAATAFDDEHGFEIFDDRREYGEERWVWFGRVAGRVLIIVVAFTEREERVRIISARPAEPEEESTYYEENL